MARFADNSFQRLTACCMIFGLAVTLVLGVPGSSFAGSKNAYTDAERQTIFNNITDSIATLGKSPKDARIIKKKRHTARYKARLQKIRESNRKAARRRRGL